MVEEILKKAIPIGKPFEYKGKLIQTYEIPISLSIKWAESCKYCCFNHNGTCKFLPHPYRYFYKELIVMERKIGEIFEYNGEWYQCVEDSIESCVNCCFYNGGHKKCSDKIGECFKGRRSDNNNVYFKKLEKVGEPYKFQKRTIQTYKLYTEPFISFDMDFINTYLNGSDTIDIIIKQNIEDMEENKLNLKPFDIQKAREGKPVCTRDGRKARIICFDFRDADKICCIIAAVDYGEAEKIHYYDLYGKYRGGDSSELDLMMLPEKKEGWVNVYKHNLYDTESEAKRAHVKEGYIDTIKIEWEE